MVALDCGVSGYSGYLSIVLGHVRMAHLQKESPMACIQIAERLAEPLAGVGAR